MKYQRILENLCRDENHFLPDVAWFWRTNQRYGVLSNFSSKEVRLGSLRFPTAEHMYQILKVKGGDLQRELMKVENPLFVKNRVRGMIKRGEILFDGYSWERDRLVLMMFVVLMKVKSNRDVYNLILKLRDRDIVEVNKRDGFWGVKPNKVFMRGEGKNMLGKIYMVIRDSLQTMDLYDFMKDFVYEEGEILKRYFIYGVNLLDWIEGSGVYIKAA